MKSFYSIETPTTSPLAIYFLTHDSPQMSYIANAIQNQLQEEFAPQDHLVSDNQHQCFQALATSRTNKPTYIDQD
jgi:hypothetical protein